MMRELIGSCFIKFSCHDGDRGSKLENFLPKNWVSEWLTTGNMYQNDTSTAINTYERTFYAAVDGEKISTDLRHVVALSQVYAMPETLVVGEDGAE